MSKSIVIFLIVIGPSFLLAQATFKFKPQTFKFHIITELAVFEARNNNDPSASIGLY